jgi:ppGpp synthetase/RelA/SpoT-type nucleotidyltranferase
MAWAVPQYSRDIVDDAGRLLISDNTVVLIEERNRALEIINNWRSSHSFPLQCLKMLLGSRARKRDGQAIIAQRLKRLQSIDAKLRQHSNWMKLTQMQDIGGCRVSCPLRLVRASESTRV